jgi:hypothetical protein
MIIIIVLKPNSRVNLELGSIHGSSLPFIGINVKIKVIIIIILKPDFGVDLGQGSGT